MNPSSSRIRLLALSFLTAALTAGGQDLPTLRSTEARIRAVHERTGPSVVALVHDRDGGQASGTGTIVSADGLVLTAAHVIRGAEEVTATFPDGSKTTGKVLGYDTASDTAMVQLAAGKSYPFVEVGDSTKLQPGDGIVALGHAGGFDPKRPAPVRFGRVVSLRQGEQFNTDCTLAGGDSGGPSFDLDGKLVGIHTTVGAELTANNDIPVEIMKAAWDRYRSGERWGLEEVLAKIGVKSDELAGMDYFAFTEAVMMEAAKSHGRLAAEPAKIRQDMIDCGMQEARAKALSEAVLMDLFARLITSIASGGDETESSIPPEELAGMNVANFRARVRGESLKSGGSFAGTRELLVQLMKDSGMNAAKADALSELQVSQLVAKIMGDSAKVKATSVPAVPAIPDDVAVPAGLDLARLSEVLTETSKSTGGKLAADPASVQAMLVKAGMKEEDAKAVDAMQFVGLAKKAMGDRAHVRAEVGQAPQGAANGSPLPEGLDVGKFKQLVIAEAMKGNGKLEVTPDIVRQWLSDCGVAEDKANSLAPEKFNDIIQSALGGAGQVMDETASAPTPESVLFAKLARETQEALKPAIAKVAPAVVTLLDGDKPLAQGAIVRPDGFILTKRSEVAKAGAKLTARLADGRSFPATEVKNFDTHDLALLKIEADALPVVEFPAASEPLPAGSFVFTPGGRDGTNIIGMGVVGGPTRQLRETGGYVGVAITGEDGSATIGAVEKDSPAAKAELKKGDVLLRVDDQACKQANDFREAIRAHKIGDKITLTFRRDDAEQQADVILAARPVSNETNPALTIGVKTSDVANGFPQVLQNDQQLTPQDCGGVVLDLEGRVAGVNIARADRISSYFIPAQVVRELLNEAP